MRESSESRVGRDIASRLQHPGTGVTGTFEVPLSWRKASGWGEIDQGDVLTDMVKILTSRGLLASESRQVLF